MLNLCSFTIRKFIVNELRIGFIQLENMFFNSVLDISVNGLYYGK